MFTILHGKNEFYVHKIMKKKDKEINASFAVAPDSAEMTAPSAVEGFSCDRNVLDYGVWCCLQRQGICWWPWDVFSQDKGRILSAVFKVN